MTIPAFSDVSLNTNSPTLICESIAQMLRARPWAMDAHSHGDLDQFFWINKGAGRVQIDGVTRGFGPNTAIFVPAGAVHGFEFTPVSAGWVITMGHQQAIPVDLPQAPVITNLNTREEQAIVTAICDEIQREQSSDAVAKETALACQAGLLSVWLRRHLERKEPQVSTENSSKRLMRRFMQLLEERYASQDTVSHYAAKLSVTPTHLTRICRQTSGKSATSLIQSRTLLEARRRLAQSDQRVNELSRDLGFASPAYFTRLFTQKTGDSPSNFRKSAQNRQSTASKAFR